MLLPYRAPRGTKTFCNVRSNGMLFFTIVSVVIGEGLLLRSL
jgi:hypothetical protein